MNVLITIRKGFQTLFQRWWFQTFIILGSMLSAAAHGDGQAAGLISLVFTTVAFIFVISGLLQCNALAKAEKPGIALPLRMAVAGLLCIVSQPFIIASTCCAPAYFPT